MWQPETELCGLHGSPGFVKYRIHTSIWNLSQETGVSSHIKSNCEKQDTSSGILVRITRSKIILIAAERWFDLRKSFTTLWPFGYIWKGLTCSLPSYQVPGVQFAANSFVTYSFSATRGHTSVIVIYPSILPHNGKCEYRRIWWNCSNVWKEFVVFCFHVSSQYHITTLFQCSFYFTYICFILAV